MNRSLLLALLVMSAACPLVPAATCQAEEEAEPSASSTELVWETDYATAMQQAERQKKMLLIHFYDDAKPGPSQPFTNQARDNKQVREKLAKFVLVRLPLDVTISSKGQPVRLLDHPSFAEMEKHQGLVVVDYANPSTDYYRYVVSTLPFKSGKYYRYNPKHVAVLLDLPPGTQTQRAMVFAVRIHPESR